MSIITLSRLVVMLLEVERDGLEHMKWNVNQLEQLNLLFRHIDIPLKQALKLMNDTTFTKHFFFGCGCFL